MEFGNPIVGNEDLIRSAIKSPDFNTDPESGNVTGWRIARDGSATFYNVTIGSTSFNIDESGNAVFADMTADTIHLNGESLEDLLNRSSRGIIAMSTSPNTSGAYNGSDPILWNRITIPQFDATRAYRVSMIARADNGSSTPSYIRSTCRFSWTGNTTASSSILYEALDVRDAATPDSIIHSEFVFMTSTPSGENMYLGFYLDAGAVAGTTYLGTNYGRVWVEDAGPIIDFSSFDASGSGGGTPPPQTYTKTYLANWSGSYQSDGDNRNISECYQGYYSGTNGNQYSLIGLPYATIQSDLSGATINKVEVYLNNNHWYQNAGGTAVIGTHTYSSEPSTASLANVNEDINRSSFTYGQAKWVTVSNSIGTALKNNTAKGIALGPGPSTSTAYYGYFAGNGQSGEPRVRITYTK